MRIINMGELLSVGVLEIIDHWYKDFDREIIHYWKDKALTFFDSEFYVVIKYSKKREIEYKEKTEYGEMFKIQNKLDFCRIFPSLRAKGKYHISVDKTILVSNLEKGEK